MKYIDLATDIQRQAISEVKKHYELPVESIEKDLWVTQVLHALLTYRSSSSLQAIA